MNGSSCNLDVQGAIPWRFSTTYTMDVLVKCQALLVADSLLNQPKDDPKVVAQEHGLMFDGEQDWGYRKFWAFTMRDAAHPAAGITFYTSVGASRDEIAQHWRRKLSEFGVE